MDEAPNPPLPPGSPPVPPPPARAMEESDARMWAAFTHLAGLVYLAGIPGILGSLVIWLWKRGDHRLINEHGKEAVNFQITLLIYNVAAFVIGACTLGLGLIVVAPLMAILAILIIVLPIIATIQASEGRPYRYPLTIRLID
jgi:uncharacterized Tic20 family protein